MKIEICPRCEGEGKVRFGTKNGNNVCFACNGTGKASGDYKMLFDMGFFTFEDKDPFYKNHCFIKDFPEFKNEKTGKYETWSLILVYNMFEKKITRVMYFFDGNYSKQIAFEKTTPTRKSIIEIMNNFKNEIK